MSKHKSKKQRGVVCPESYKEHVRLPCETLRRECQEMKTEESKKSHWRVGSNKLVRSHFCFGWQPCFILRWRDGRHKTGPHSSCITVTKHPCSSLLYEDRHVPHIKASSPTAPCHAHPRKNSRYLFPDYTPQSHPHATRVAYSYS